MGLSWVYLKVPLSMHVLQYAEPKAVVLGMADTMSLFTARMSNIQFVLTAVILEKVVS